MARSVQPPAALVRRFAAERRPPYVERKHIRWRYTSRTRQSRHRSRPRAAERVPRVTAAIALDRIGAIVLGFVAPSARRARPRRTDNVAAEHEPSGACACRTQEVGNRESFCAHRCRECACRWLVTTRFRFRAYRNEL